MTFTQLALLYPAQFREALRDLSLVEVAGLLDGQDYAELGNRISKSLEAAKEEFETTPVSDVADPVSESRRADIAEHHRKIARRF